MSSDIAISVRNVSKRFEMYAKPRDRLLQFFTLGKKEYFRSFWALKNISFDVKKGEVVGILGQNGAGKSTLLQIICGTLSPTSGEVASSGRVSALLELGSGFNPEFSGIDNIYLSGAILGLTRQEIESKIQEIADFADIGDFIHQPVKSYSSGMYARLAFAVAVSVEPEVLVVDETLAVGDMLFQAKAVQRMRSLMSRCTVLFVSHSLGTIKSFCDRAILIDKGEIVRDGKASEVCDFYEMLMQERLLARAGLRELSSEVDGEMSAGYSFSTKVEPDPGFPEAGEEFRSGSGAMRVIRGDLLVNGRQSSNASFKDSMCFRLVIKANETISAGAIVGYMIRNSNAIDVIGCNLFNEKQALPELRAGQYVVVEFRFPCLLSNGQYSINVGVKSEPFLPEFFDLIHVARTFEVAPIPGNYVPGLVYVENEIKVSIIGEHA